MVEIEESNTGLPDEQEYGLREGMEKLFSSFSIEHVNILQF
jgi:hypothetical protein